MLKPHFYLGNTLPFLSLLFGLLSSSAWAQSEDILSVGNSLTAGLTKGGGVIRCAAQGNRLLTAAQQIDCKGNGEEGVGGWQPRLKSLTRVKVYNYGNSGEQSDAIAARLASHLTERASKYVLIMAGTNDVIRGIATSTIMANIQSMINLSKNAGRTPIVGTIPPLSGSQFANRNADVVALNSQLRNLSDVAIADHYAAVVDDWATYTSGDFIHFGSAGNTQVADTWFAAIKRLDKNNNAIPAINSLILQ